MKVNFNHIEGSRKGTSQSFDTPTITVGRDPTSSIAFDPHKDDRVSTKHAQIVEQGGQLTITDLGSRNGTYVNGTRISAPTPVPPGALVQFGEGGPQVMVMFDAPASAAPAPAAAKKSGGGGAACVVIALLGIVFLGAAAVAVYFLVFRGVSGVEGPGVHGPTPIVVATGSPTLAASPQTPAASPAAPAASPAAPAATPTPAAPAASPSPAATKVYESPWNKLGVGSLLEFDMATHMEKPMVSDTKMGLRYKVSAKTDDEITVQQETLMSGMTLPPQDTKYKVHAEGAAGTTETKTLEERDESVTVPAGTFACHYTKTEMTTSGTHMVTESWMPKDLPLPVKSKTVSDGNGMQSTSEMTLTKLDKK